MAEETIRVTQHLLGAAPYTLIELRPASDGSGEPALFIEAGGGAGDQPTYMPLLVVTEAEAGEGNPLAVMLRDVAREHGSADHVQVITAIVEQINEEWLPFVFGEVRA